MFGGAVLDHQDAALLLQVYDCARDGSDWPGMLSGLARSFQADAFHLFRDGVDCSRRGPQTAPLPACLIGLRTGRVYLGEELQQRQPGPQSAFSGSDARAIGLMSCGALVWMMVTRRKGQFRAVDSARLSAFAPHIVQALGLFLAQQALLAEQTRSHALLRRLGVGIVRVDLRKRAVQPDLSAQRLLRDHAITPVRLLESLRRQTDRPVIIPLSPSLEMLLEPSAQDGDAQIVTALLRTQDGILPEPETLAGLFGITRSEARLAHALATGHSLRSAAAQLGLSIETARNYSKRIYMAAGLRGQTALVRRLWASAVLLAR